MDQLLYFLNHIADQNVSSNARGNNFLIMLGVPTAIAIYIVLVAMRKARGNTSKLTALIVLSYIVCVLVPLLVIIHSLIYLRQIQSILPASLLFLFFGLGVGLLVEEYYPRFRYKTDEIYRREIFLNGHNIEERIIDCKLLLYWNNIFFISNLFYLIGVFASLYEWFSHETAWVGGVILIIGFLATLIFLVWLRWYFRCPYCHNTVYGLETRRMQYYAKYYYLSIMLRILRYHRFTCMYCHGHFILGERDIIKERGWTIENLHEPDFTVVKKPR